MYNTNLLNNFFKYKIKNDNIKLYGGLFKLKEQQQKEQNEEEIKNDEMEIENFRIINDLSLNDIDYNILQNINTNIKDIEINNNNIEIKKLGNNILEKQKELKKLNTFLQDIERININIKPLILQQNFKNEDNYKKLFDIITRLTLRFQNIKYKKKYIKYKIKIFKYNSKYVKLKEIYGGNILLLSFFLFLGIIPIYFLITTKPSPELLQELEKQTNTITDLNNIIISQKPNVIIFQQNIIKTLTIKNNELISEFNRLEQENEMKILFSQNKEFNSLLNQIINSSLKTDLDLDILQQLLKYSNDLDNIINKYYNDNIK
jgi:hypothetical protein